MRRAALALAALCLLSQRAAAQGGVEDDAVDQLPELDVQGNLTMYSGYLPVRVSPKTDLFYTVVYAEVPDPGQAPLIVWLGGAPGCSSFGPGVFQGPGPFVFEAYDGPAQRNISDLRVARNIGSWTSFANMLFLDAPVGAGWSKSDGPETTWSDATTTDITLVALQTFFDSFPGFETNRLFLAGQGYAGHTVPLLAQAILKYNSELPEGGTPLDLQGIAVSNPWVHPEWDNMAAVNFWFNSGLVSGATYKALLASCDMKKTALWRTEGASGVAGACEAARNAALQEAYPVDLWGTNAPKCQLQAPGNGSGLAPAVLLPPAASADAQGPQPKALQPNLRLRPGGMPSSVFDPCAAWRTLLYLNEQSVQEALHAIQPGEAVRPWEACNAAVQYEEASIVASVLPAYRELLNTTVRILVYSGDTDAVFTAGGTRTWVETLGLAPDAPWRAWMDAMAWSEPGGFMQVYAGPTNGTGGLTFATILEAGQNAAYFKPIKTLQLVRAFTNNVLKLRPPPPA